ncbi:hypothetical protein M0R45_009892 [Rubus argutus]|uniref:Uncharacterized protein n=1 Tax=Rubus argutus TaxID=59490 RepID=A0AAW1Y5R7_RUBAR
MNKMQKLRNHLMTPQFAKRFFIDYATSLANVAVLIDMSWTIQSSLGYRDPNLLDHVCKHNCRRAGFFVVLTMEIEETINLASKFSDACAVYVDSGHRRIESSPRLMLAGIYY